MTSTLLLLTLALSDPRVPLVELRMEGRDREALLETDRLLARDEPPIDELGLWYLRGDLLDRLGRRSEAVESFARAMSESPELRAHARLRIALDQEALGHPEVAAGLAATLLGASPPATLVPKATRLLTRSLQRGGDCRLISNLALGRFADNERRSLQLARAECDLAAGRTERAVAALADLMREKQSDLTALLAAQRLDALSHGQVGRDLAELLGRTFHQHRQFELSVAYLQRLVRPQAEVRSSREFETRYRLVRGHFWQGQYEAAASRYLSLANSAISPRHVAQSLYHRGRSLELAGQWSAAIESFSRTYLAQPEGNFASAALLSRMRLEWLSGNEPVALELYASLRERPQSRLERSRAALFLASSDIVRGRSDRALHWLADADAASRQVAVETSFWRGRAAELRGDDRDAVTAYADAAERDYFHPLGQLAVEHLRSADLRESARKLGRQLAEQGRQLLRVWVLLGDEDPIGAAARRRFLSRLERSAGGPLLPAETVPAAEWPLWSAPLNQPEDRLLALGIFDEGERAVSRHFPLTEPALALTAAAELAEAGEHRRSLLIVEILRDRFGNRLPAQFAPVDYRRLLYPYPYRYLIERSAERHGVDARVLAALIREESRFDPTAQSAAAARGLTQFVLSTAREIAAREAMGPLEPSDLERPEISIELGAAYLRDLADRLGPSHAVIAAYNAGEPQVHLWQRYCHSEEPAEFLTKVAFQETRHYLRKVLTAYAQYRSLYPSEPGKSRASGLH